MDTPREGCQAIEGGEHCRTAAEVRAQKTDSGELLALCRHHYEGKRLNGLVGEMQPLDPRMVEVWEQAENRWQVRVDDTVWEVEWSPGGVNLERHIYRPAPMWKLRSPAGDVDDVAGVPPVTVEGLRQLLADRLGSTEAADQLFKLIDPHADEFGGIVPNKDL